MALFDKHFTLEEARGWLPALRQRFGRIRSLYAELQELQADFERAQKLIQGNGHAPKPPAIEPRLQELRELLEQIVSAGIEVKDVGRGLVDFPHWRGDEEVFLCWELSEDDLEYWHPIDAGFAGRQPL